MFDGRFWTSSSSSFLPPLGGSPQHCKKAPSELFRIFASAAHRTWLSEEPSTAGSTMKMLSFAALGSSYSQRNLRQLQGCRSMRTFQRSEELTTTWNATKLLDFVVLQAAPIPPTCKDGSQWWQWRRGSWYYPLQSGTQVHFPPWLLLVRHCCEAD